MHTLALDPQYPNVSKLPRPRMWHRKGIKPFFPSSLPAFFILKNKCTPSPKRKASTIPHFFVKIPTPNPFETAAIMACLVVASWTAIFRLTMRLWRSKAGLDDVSILKSLFDPALTGIVFY
jgi:hypothetical protein